MTSDFAAGLLFWLHGWRLILSRRRLLLCAALPFAIALLGMSSLLYLLWSYLASWSHAWIDWIGLTSGFWSQILYYPLLLSAGALASIVAVYSVYVLQDGAADDYRRNLDSIEINDGGSRLLRHER